MSTLKANLKHYYQRRGMWFVHLVTGLYLFAAIVGPIANPRADKGNFVAPLFLMLLFGLTAGVTVLDVMVRPFSFCLPNHVRTVRRVLILIGLLCSALIAQIFWLYPGLTTQHLAAAVISSFGSCLVVYWSGVAITLAVRNIGSLIGLIIFAFFIGQVFGLHVIAERFIINQPVVLSLAGAAATLLAWSRLGRRSLARRKCCTPWIGFVDAFNRQKVLKYAQANRQRMDKMMRNASPWVEAFFIRMMGTSRGTMRSIWAALYSGLGLGLSNWKRSALFVIILTLTMGYMGQATWFMLTFMPMMAAMGLRLPAYSTMLTAAGRRERFTCTLVNSVVVSIIFGLTLVAIIALLGPLSRIVPPVTLSEHITMTLKPLDIRLCLIPLVMLPAVMTMHLLFYSRPAILIIAILLVTYAAFFIMMVGHDHLAVFVNPFLILALLIGGWLAYVLTLHHICRRWCLVR